jgi:cell division protein FtsI (penicillin-binding protein 3)
VLRIERRQLLARLRRDSNFVFLARWVAPERAARVRALALPGVGILDEPRRVYPHRELAAQVLGFANIDGEGVRGIEQQEDAWLRGRAQSIAVERERDARGGLLVSGGLEGWSTAGGDVRLTLDMALQAEAAAALRDAVAATGARGGVVLSLDPSRATCSPSPRRRPSTRIVSHARVPQTAHTPFSTRRSRARP